MTRGRPVDASKRLGRCDGSEDAKVRTETVVAYLARELTAEEASARLGIGESPFHEIVTQGLQGMVVANEPGTAGRPRIEPEEDDETIELKAKVAKLERDLKLAALLAEGGWVPYQRDPPKKT